MRRALSPSPEGRGQRAEKRREHVFSEDLTDSWEAVVGVWDGPAERAVAPGWSHARRLHTSAHTVGGPHLCHELL